MDNELLTPGETAKLLRTSTAVLAVARCRRLDHPPFLRLGRRILYKRSEVSTWLEKHTVAFDSGAEAERQGTR